MNVTKSAVGAKGTCLRVATFESCWNDQASPYRFSICGQISIIRAPDTVKQMSKYKVVLSSQDKDKALVTVETDAHGSFCFKAKPGIYKVQVHDVFGLKCRKAGKVAQAIG